VGVDIKQRKNNPEIDISDFVMSSSVQQQILDLKKAAERLRGNYIGEDAYWGLDGKLILSLTL